MRQILGEDGISWISRSVDIKLIPPTPINYPHILDDFGRRSKYHTNSPLLPCLGTIFHEKKAKNMISLYEPTFFRRKFLKFSISQ